jgi:hypothetical protein
VMVGFLGVIFYAALSGNALPDAARKQIEKVLPSWLLASNKPAAEKSKDSSAVNATSDAPLFNNPQAAKPALNINSAPRTLATNDFATPLSPLSANGAATGQGQNTISPVMPVDYQTPVEVSPGAMVGAQPAALPNDNLPVGSSLADTSSLQIQDRLKQLGATYFLLETWGNQQQAYRFYCKMAVGGNTNYTHCFEYISTDPLQAMGEVLKQVENWRSGGSLVR